MAEDDTIEEGVFEQLVQKLTPCIERGNLDVCVEEAARLADELGVGADELLALSAQMGEEGKYELVYMLALGAVDKLASSEKAKAYFNAGFAAQSLGNVDKAEVHYIKAIKADPKLAVAHLNYANLLDDFNRTDDAESYYLKAIDTDPKLAAAHSNYALLLKGLNRADDAESHYLKAIDADPKLAVAHLNYANLLEDFNRTDDAESHYLKAIDADPKLAGAHYNYALLLEDFNRTDDAESHYLKAIDSDPKYAAAHFNYALLLEGLGEKAEATIHYLKAIEIDPSDAAAHSNYALLLKELNRTDDAEIHYLKAIDADPKLAAAHFNYALLLKGLNRTDDAEFHYLKAIEIDPNLVEPHGAYSLLLIDSDRRGDALSEIESASELLKNAGRITESHIAKAWFYQKYSEKYFNQKEYRKSSDDADKASDEYFKAAETAEGDLLNNLILQGNVLKAKSFMRKIPPKSWYNKIYKKHGIKLDISKLVYNLQNAAIWYQKASVCEVEGKKDVCTACHLSISVFSEVLDAMSAFISGNNAEITKDKWLNSLEGAGKTYADKELKTGIALVDSLKQLVKCVDKLAEQRAVGLRIQEERLGKCYDNLTTVNENLGGVLGIISDHATEAIRDYAKKEGMGFVDGINPKKPFYDNWLVKATVGAIVAIILGIIANQLFEWRIQDKVFAWIYNM